MPETEEQVTCMECGYKFVPSFAFDFYPEGNDPKVGRCESCIVRQAIGSTYSAPSLIPGDHVEKVCKPGKGHKTCSFIGAGAGDSVGFKCLKGSSFEATIRERRENGTIRAKGDNCSGPPDFKVP